ncbi:type IV-A pilus assembly ATPase PilB [Grimontia hollisae]|uniref:Type II traffic warden ATPase n=1 Tax=Grimontia hollisae TaxID=673 RepID=A0A377HJZ3_GRIHO|nr:type IV-A pilus assembly ATPase PilB [Grimontia hollisae]STO56404.1 Type II traffic warden ATPase [Grimontia hollisae]STQ77544.1 Type II traffic warden ATPase [Grimontia hollisae]
MNSNLAVALRRAGYISPAQEQEVIAKVKAEGVSAPSALLALHILSSEALANTVSELFSEPLHSIKEYPWENTSQFLNQQDLVLSSQALPLEIKHHQLFLGLSDPTRLDIQDDFQFATGYSIVPVLLEHAQIEGAIRRLYGKNVTERVKTSGVSDSELEALSTNSDEITDTDDLFSDDAPVSRYIQQVLLDAVRKQASDIHFEPFEQRYQIRFRLDGILQTHSTPPVGISRRLSTRLKIIAKLNIAERRLPQDGRIKLNLSENKSIDMRVSTLPTLWGEKVVLRILDGGSVALDIDKLGYSQQQKDDYLAALDRPQGMILMTGPTGSGKTVSLYTGLKYLNTAERNISTAEDPVEINLPGINQVNINNDIGLDFAKALRAFLRQDPDVVMVGEIRDLETAEIGIKAAQTGHLVLSTLHTNSAAESVTRLSNMGVAPYNLAASLTLIIAQRLGRRLCQHCKVPHPPGDRHLTALTQHYPSLRPEQVYQASPEGCDHCNNGYLGRVGIYEVMPITRELAEAIGNGASASRIETLAMGNGMLTLPLSGIEKLNEGITSLAELQRVISL